MLPCDIGYIPKRLHTGNREPFNVFVIGEQLYHRCKPEVLDNPYKDITITELSHNRGGINPVLSEPEDVLWSIKAESGFEKYDDKVICTLVIIDLNENGEYDKTFEQLKNGELVIANIKLLHAPEPCMYPHCVFRVWIQNEIVTYENSRQTIDRVKEIRTKIKAELAAMIFTRQVRQSALNNQ